MKKSLYKEDNVLTYNKEGLQLSQNIEKVIEPIYSSYLNQGYHPSEIREIILSQVFIISGIQDALHF